MSMTMKNFVMLRIWSKIKNMMLKGLHLELLQE